MEPVADHEAGKIAFWRVLEEELREGDEDAVSIAEVVDWSYSSSKHAICKY